MAVVPRKIEADATLNPETRGRFQAVDRTAGLRAVGESISQVGANLGSAAQEDERMDAARDNAAARDLDTEAISRFGDVRRRMLEARGLNAGVVRPGADLELDEVQRDLIGRTTTPRQREILTGVLTQRRSAMANLFDDHERGQVVEAEDNASLARATASSEDAIATIDPDARRAAIDTGLGELAALGRRRGQDEAQIAADQLRYESGVHLGVVNNLIDGDNVDGALAYVRDNADRIGAADEARISTALRAPLQHRETIGDVDAAMGGAGAVASGTPGDGVVQPQAGRVFRPTPGPLLSAYGADRSGVPLNGRLVAGRRHEGADIRGAVGDGVFAPDGGTVEVRNSPGGLGLHVELRTANGDRHLLGHLSAASVRSGQRVTAGQRIGAVGDTGNARGGSPHLHWQLQRNGRWIDPMSALDPSQPAGGAQQAPRRHDLNASLAAVDRLADAGGWSPERRDRAKAEVERRVGQDEQLAARAEAQAERAALDVVTDLGERFTSISQLPASVRSSLSPDVELRLQGIARQNATPAPIRADGDTALTLNLMAISDPAAFQSTDLRGYRAQMTPNEFASLAMLQARARTAPAETVDHGRIWSVINQFGAPLGASTTQGATAEQRQTAMRIFSLTRNTVNGITGGTRQATDDEVMRAFNQSTMEVTVREEGVLWGTRDRQVRRFEVPDGGRAFVNPPASVRSRIVESYRRSNGGRAPSAQEIGQIYVRHRGQPGFWQ